MDEELELRIWYLENPEIITSYRLQIDEECCGIVYMPINEEI